MKSFFLTLHILSGSVALLSGLPAILSKKGGRMHLLSGKFYFPAMLFTGLSGLLISLIDHHNFLFPISVFCLYMIISGRIAVSYRRKTPSHTALVYYRIFSLSGLITGLYMLASGIQALVHDGMGIALILPIFGAITFGMAFMDFSKSRLPSFTSPHKLMTLHISRMGGSYIAACTAFFSVNIKFLPPLVIWLMPTVLGSVLISYAIFRYTKQQNKKTSRMLKENSVEV